MPHGKGAGRTNPDILRMRTRRISLKCVFVKGKTCTQVTRGKTFQKYVSSCHQFPRWSCVRLDPSHSFISAIRWTLEKNKSVIIGLFLFFLCQNRLLFSLFAVMGGNFSMLVIPSNYWRVRNATPLNTENLPLFKVQLSDKKSSRFLVLPLKIGKWTRLEKEELRNSTSFAAHRKWADLPNRTPAGPLQKSKIEKRRQRKLWHKGKNLFIPTNHATSSVSPFFIQLLDCSAFLVLFSSDPNGSLP